MTVLQSIFPATKELIKASDFAGLERLQINGKNARDGVDGETAASWNRLIGLRPDRLVALTEHNFGIELKIAVELNGFYADIEFKPPNADYFSGGITLSPNEVRDTRISVREDFQGQGIGNAWLKTCIEFLHAVGREKLPMSAGLENGAYSWGRAGAYLQKDPSTVINQMFASHEIMSMLDAVSFAVPKPDYHKAKVYARLTNKDDLARLCELDTPVRFDPESDMPHILENLENFLLVNKLNPDPVGLIVHRSHETLKHVFERATVQEKPVTLPRLLLTRRTLDVAFDFNDAKQMERVGNRLGGWQHLVPA